MNRHGIFPYTVFLGAFLLFQIQPLIGKYFLPWFGGAPAVWTSCLMFFQLLLLGGYAYAHLMQRLAPRRQVLVHCALLAVALAAGIGLCFVWGNPVLPSLAWRPQQNVRPTLTLLGLLLFSVGLPYFLLSSSASLLQAWFHRARPARSPYVLYIISNTASLIALVSYPLLAEPFFTIKTQALLWFAGFLLYALLCAWAGRSAMAVPPVAETVAPDSEDTRPAWYRYLLWIALSACGVLALMAITNQMTQDIPPVPFLWVLPLVLYLLSYVIGFIDRFARNEWWHDIRFILLALGCYLGWYLIHHRFAVQIVHQIAGYSAVLFFICLFCHGELYHLKPSPRNLTGFYLSISAGGVLGGIFVAVLAPLLFKSYWEYQLALGLSALLAVASVYVNKGSMLRPVRHALWIAVPVLLFFVFRDGLEEDRRALFRDRNFFGKVYVMARSQFNDTVTCYELKHGHITHGAQFDHPVYRKYTTTYYTEQSGAGLALLDHPKRRVGEPMRVGLLGMGVGTLAAYGREGDLYRFYEINPTVIRLAENSRWFTYLAESAATVEVVPGDGRIALENELKQEPMAYDVLVIDVFSGDQVPIHVLTKEAFGIYLENLAPDGVIAIHISSRYLDLVPPLRAVKDHFSLYGALIESPKKGLGSASTWVLLSRTDRILRFNPAGLEGRSVRLWTDDYSNLFSVLKQ